MCAVVVVFVLYFLFASFPTSTFSLTLKHHIFSHFLFCLVACLRSSNKLWTRRIFFLLLVCRSSSSCASDTLMRTCVSVLFIGAVFMHTYLCINSNSSVIDFISKLASIVTHLKRLWTHNVECTLHINGLKVINAHRGVIAIHNLCINDRIEHSDWAIPIRAYSMGFASNKVVIGLFVVFFFICCVSTTKKAIK